MPTLATNRRIRRDYNILAEYEAGIELTGPEVKSAKAGQINLQDSYVRLHDGNAVLVNAYIAPYQAASLHRSQDPDPYRTRRLLLHKSQIEDLQRAQQGSGVTVVALRMYTSRGLVKLKIGLARGKKNYEKKRVQKERDIKRQAATEMKDYKT